MRISKEFTNKRWLKIRCESFRVRFHSFAQKGYGELLRRGRITYQEFQDQRKDGFFNSCTYQSSPGAAFSAYEDRQSPFMAHQVVVEKHTASSFNETTFNVDFASQSLPAPHESKVPRRNLVVDLKRKSCDVATKSFAGGG